MTKSCLCYSGGKDSTALWHRLIEEGRRPDVVVMALHEMEYPPMYDFINWIEEKMGQEIIREPPIHTWDEWFYGHRVRGKHTGQIRGFPMVQRPCWFMRNAKAVPLRKYNKEYDIIYVGYSASEKERVMDSPKFVYPLQEWGMTDKDCMRYCKNEGILNPLYKLGLKRLGCWSCPNQGAIDLMIKKLYFPELFSRMLQYEKDSPHGFRPRVKLCRFEEQAVLEVFE